MKSLLFLLVLISSCSSQERELFWADEFEGSGLDMEKWNFELGDGCPELCGWGNNESQIYTDTNHRLENGHLIITARLENGRYTSTRITTKDKLEFQYGRVEARIKLPTGLGTWSAFWMLGSNIDEVGWPLCGEIDIMESVGNEPGVLHTSLHTQASHGNTINTAKTTHPDLQEDYHLYACEWSSEAIRFYLDDQLVYAFAPEEKIVKTWPFDQPFYLLLNLAIGGNFNQGKIDDSIFPQEYVVDYVRVYDLGQ